MGMDVTLKDCNIIVEELDSHGQCGINFVDFLKAMYDEHDRATSNEDMSFLFTSMDTDGDGYVDIYDIQLLFKKSGALISKTEVTFFSCL